MIIRSGSVCFAHEGVQTFDFAFSLMTQVSKRSKSPAEVRKACRDKWGKDWWKCHPAIKKCRMLWAQGGAGGTVQVTEAEAYVI